MEKINALIDKLQQLKNDRAGLSEIAYYTQLLYAELMCAKKTSGPEKQEQGLRKKVAVIMPEHAAPAMVMQNSAAVEKEPEPVKEPVVVRRRETAEARGAEPRYAGAEMNGTRFQAAEAKSRTLFDHAAEAENYRTVTEAAAAREINEAIAEHTPSLNDKLKRENIELAARLTDSVPVRDLSGAIDINNKFLFINELFRGDRNMFDRSVKTINECASLEEAEYWMGRELKIKLGWQDKNDAVQQFYQLVRKRFS